MKRIGKNEDSSDGSSDSISGGHADWQATCLENRRGF